MALIEVAVTMFLFPDTLILNIDARHLKYRDLVLGVWDSRDEQGVYKGMGCIFQMFPRL